MTPRADHIHHLPLIHDRLLGGASAALRNIACYAPSCLTTLLLAVQKGTKERSKRWRARSPRSHSPVLPGCGYGGVAAPALAARSQSASL